MRQTLDYYCQNALNCVITGGGRGGGGVTVCAGGCEGEKSPEKLQERGGGEGVEECV